MDGISDVAALNEALERHQWDVAERLAGRGINLDAWVDEQTVLSNLAAAGDVEAVRWLLARGARPGARNDDGTTALTWTRSVAVMQVLCDAGASVENELQFSSWAATSVHYAAEDGDMERLRLLISRMNGRVALETFDLLERTPLACAAYEGHVAALDYLIEAGADVNAYQVERGGQTPLQCAIEMAHLDCVTRLLQVGADPLLSAPNNPSPLVLAAEHTLAPEFLLRVQEAASRHTTQG